MKKIQILVLILLLTTDHTVDASNQQPAKLYEMEHENWYGTCSKKRCPNPFDDLIFEDNDQIQLHGGSCQEWINHRKNDENTLLSRAVKTNNIEEVKRLVEIGADVDMQDKQSHTLLHWAVYMNAKEITQLLLAAGAIVNQQDNNGETPLHFAAGRNSYKTIQLLLDAGADVNQQNKSGNTPLHWAAKKNRYEIVQLLLASGAHINQQNEFGDTPLHLAVYNRNNETILLLLAARASAAIKNNRKESPRKLADNEVIREMFYQAEATIRNRNREFRTNEETRTIFNEAAVTPDNLINNSFNPINNFCSIS